MINSKFGNIAEQINAKIGIFAVINEYINLKRKGKDYVALCPFHEDKHPSLLVSEKKQIFKCFSCNTGGGAVKFVMLYENLNYQKALKIISKKHQITIENFSYESQEHSEQTKKMLEIVQETHNFYKLQMLNPPLFLRKYLNKRKITPRIVEKYEIGWAPEQKDALYNYLREKDFNDGDILATELFNLNKKEQIRDFFTERLIFPLLNKENELVGFSGRIVKEKNQTKFLISRESLLFQKNELLFNWTFINQNFKAQKEIYLTEGFLDAIRLTEFKLPAVAILGTQLTEKQIALIKERYRNIIVVPDGDDAGKISALKSVLNLQTAGFIARIWNHGTNWDPDELLQKNPQILEKKEKQIISPTDFIIENYSHLNDEKKLQKFNDEIEPFLPFLSQLEQHLFFKKIEKKYNIPQTVLKKQWSFENVSREIVLKPTTSFEHSKKFEGQNWELMLMFWALKLPRVVSLTKYIPGRFATEKYNEMWPEVLKWNVEYSLNLFEKKQFLDKIISQDVLEWFQIFFTETEELISSDNEEIGEVLLNDLLRHWHREYLKIEYKKIKEKIDIDISDAFKLKELKQKINDWKLDIVTYYTPNKKNDSKT